MKKHQIATLVIFLVGVNFLNAQIQNVKMYTFGHSLIDHRPPLIATPSDETTILHWINDIAQEAGRDFSTGGQYGFLTSHDDTLPPDSQWGYDNIPSVWDASTEPFADADINTILITAANFIQYEASTSPHPLDNSTTVVQATETIFDWVNGQESNVRYYIYANWPEMDLQNAYPPTVPTQTEITDFHNLTIGEFTDWWITYQDNMLLSRPQLNTRLIPVGAIISKIIKNIIPNQVPFSELYEDSAPHGRATLYFIAGMITYMAIYGENIPNTYMPNNIVHQAIRDNLGTIRNFIWAELNNFNLPNGDSRVFYNSNLRVDDVQQSNNIRLFPNPNNGTFNISGNFTDAYTVNIIDVFGRVYQSIQSDLPSLNIDLKNMSNGLYFIHIYNDKVSYTKQILKTE